MKPSEHWQQRCRHFEQEMAFIPADPWVFCGDSLTEEFPLERFFPDKPVVNRGISGDYLAGLKERLDISILHLNPSHIFLMIGINDIGEKRPLSYMTSLYHDIIGHVVSHLPATPLWMQSILPISRKWTPCDPQQIDAVNALLASEASTYGYTFIDLFTAFATEDQQLKAELTYDGLHLNQNGYRLWADMLRRMFV